MLQRVVLVVSKDLGSLSGRSLARDKKVYRTDMASEHGIHSQD